MYQIIPPVIFNEKIGTSLSFTKKEYKSYRLTTYPFEAKRYRFSIRSSISLRRCVSTGDYLRDRAGAASRESLNANFASSNGTVFLRLNRPVDTGFRGLRQDLEGFLSAERKGSGGMLLSVG